MVFVHLYNLKSLKPGDFEIRLYFKGSISRSRGSNLPFSSPDDLSLANEQGLERVTPFLTN